MTVIEIRPFRNGWRCFEAPGVEPVFLNQEHAIDYAAGRVCFRSGEIRILDLAVRSRASFHLVRRIEDSDLKLAQTFDCCEHRPRIEGASPLCAAQPSVTPRQRIGLPNAA